MLNICKTLYKQAILKSNTFLSEPYKVAMKEGLVVLLRFVRWRSLSNIRFQFGTGRGRVAT